jgi:hypothetical protein
MYSTGEELFFSAAKLVFGFTVLQAYIAQTVETVDCLSVVCHYSTAFSSFTGNRGKVYFSAEHTGPRSHLYFISCNSASAGTHEYRVSSILLTQLNLCILSLFCRLFLLLRETGEKCIFLPNMQALVAIYILGKLLSYGPRPQIFFNQGIGRDICVATKWGRIHGYARAPK